VATTYIVLRKAESEGRVRLDELGRVSADTPRQAIKVFSEPDGEVNEGGYVATPERNWTEEECWVETRVRYGQRGDEPEDEEPDEADDLDAIIAGEGDEVTALVGAVETPVAAANPSDDAA